MSAKTPLLISPQRVYDELGDFEVFVMSVANFAAALASVTGGTRK
jgi:hypothetical protein